MDYLSFARLSNVFIVRCRKPNGAIFNASALAVPVGAILVFDSY
jgi:hypothetical protein